MKKNLLLLGLAFAASLLAGCAGSMKVLEYEMPSIDDKPPQSETMIVQNRSGPTWAQRTGGLKGGFITKGRPNATQIKAVQKGEEVCRFYTDAKTPSLWTTVPADMILAYPFGYVGLRTASHAFHGTNPAEYGEYGGAATGIAGGISGVFETGGKTYTFDGCFHNFFTEVHPEYKIYPLQ